MTQLTSTHDAPSGGCPVSEIGAAYRPFDHAGMYAAFARARREEPVFYCPEINYWVVTRREDMIAVLRDAKRFSAANALSPVTPMPASVLKLFQDGGYGVEATQVSCDPPQHTRIRRLAGPLFGLREMRKLEPRIAGVVRAYTDRLDGRGRVDMVADYAYELPAHVIFLMLGIPDADTPKIKQWADNRLLFSLGKLDETQQLTAAAQMLDYWRYCVAMVEDRKRAPGDDYASRLLAARAGDDANLSENEIASLVFGLLLAGHETTSNMTANAIHALLSHRDQWELICQDRSLIPGAVEECLRYASSVVCWRRKALEDVEIRGIRLPAGANILLALGSGNRDDACFDDPDRLDVRRANAADHVSFGHSIHFCLGAPLARLELRLILEQLTSRFPGMTLAEPGDPPMIPTIAFRGPEHLWVDLAGTGQASHE